MRSWSNPTGTEFGTKLKPVISTRDAGGADVYDAADDAYGDDDGDDVYARGMSGTCHFAKASPGSTDTDGRGAVFHASEQQYTPRRISSTREAFFREPSNDAPSRIGTTVSAV